MAIVVVLCWAALAITIAVVPGISVVTGGAVLLTHVGWAGVVSGWRLSNGRGLLADGGVSVSNVFSGDAPTSLLTMSTIGRRGASGRPARYVAAYLLDPFGLTRSLFLTIGEIVNQEVAAFEDLIGCHGGLGGRQDRAVLVHPAAWPVDGELAGADAVHRQLVRWLERFGDRPGPGMA